MVEVLGSYETPPSIAQVGAILNGKDQSGAVPRVTVKLKADGNTDIMIDRDTLK